ncbi:MAG TPA: hypothetical protein VFM34_00680 [Moraxellaceae bacterium]|nr:hypothetical protein [Moraxellaceae bacterium]
MKKLLCLAPLAIVLSGCAAMGTTGASAPASTSSSGGAAASPANVATFINRIETARGSALGMAEKVAVGGAVTETRGLVDGAQQRFVGALSQVSGLDGATVGALYPPVGAPLSQTETVQKLESRMGRKLATPQADAVKAATALRNNSLSSLKSNLAGHVGKTVGLDPEIVESLMPLVGL